MMQRLLGRGRRLPSTPLQCSDDSGTDTPSPVDGPGHEDNLDIEATQEVVWKDSPKPYRPFHGHQSYTEVLQRELSSIGDLLGDKENNEPSPDCHRGLITPRSSHRYHRHRNSNSSSFLGNLLSKRSPLPPPTPSCSSASSSLYPSSAEKTPSSISSSARKRPRPSSDHGPSSSPHRPTKTAPSGDGLMAAPRAVGSSGGLGGLARSLRQGRFRLHNLWRKNHNPVKQEAIVSPVRNGDGAQEFLNILEQVEERLSQEEDSLAVHTDNEGAKEDSHDEEEMEVEEQEEAKAEPPVAHKREEEQPAPDIDKLSAAPQKAAPPPARQEPEEEEDEFASFTAADWEKILQMEHAATQPSQVPPAKEVKCPSPVPPSPRPPPTIPAVTNSMPPPPPPTRPACTPQPRSNQTAAIDNHSYSQRAGKGGGDDNLAFPYRRYKVVRVHDDRNARIKSVVARAEPSEVQHELHISGLWYEAPMEEGTFVHVVSTEPGSIDPRSPSPEEGEQLPVVEVNNNENYLIVHPDVFVSPSAVVSAVDCDRRAILQERVSSSMSQSSSAVMGQLKHLLFQDMLMALNEGTAILRDGKAVVDFLESMVGTVIAKRRLTILGAQLTEATVRHDLICMVRPMVEWARACYLNQPLERRPNSALHQTLKIEATSRVEENIWSAGLGLRGQIDASLRVHPLEPDFRKACLPSQQEPLDDGKNQPAVSVPDPGLVLVPLELKTGRRTKDLELRHKAQVLLYSLMLRDRYGSPRIEEAGTKAETSLLRASRAGVLAYAENDLLTMDTVLPDPHSVRALLAARNRVAANSLSQYKGLPPIDRNYGVCSRCFQQSECMIYHKAHEDGRPDTTAVSAYFLAATSSMGPVDLEYFVKWDRLIDLEAKGSSSWSKSIWHRSGLTIEEASSRCMGDMVCIGWQMRVGLEGSTYLYTFGRRAGPQSVPVARSLLELSMGVGDRVLISSEARVTNHTGELRPFRHVNICNGTIINVTDSVVEVSCTKPINLPGVADPFSEQHRTTSKDGQQQQRQGGSASLELAYEDLGYRPRGSSLSQRGPLCTQKDIVVFRVDKDNTSMNFATMRENLIRLFTGPAVNQNPPGKGLKLLPSKGDEQRQRLVVHLEPPQFAESSNHPIDPAYLFRNPGFNTTPGCSPGELLREYASLNSDQREAVERVIAAKDYVLLRGMPGTGKTATIAFVVRALVCRGARVLITSYTHSAVDNLLLKLRGKGVPFLRVGRPSQVHPALHDAILDAESDQEMDLTVTALQARLRSTRVLASTCLSMRHPLFATEHFDYCIVDEAGQICQPVCLGPLRAAQVFVLVGDDNQLSPLVVSPEAREGGMAESLFTRLATAHPEAVQRLSYQYRMNQDIMTVCNELVYQNQLKCANDEVASSRLDLTSPDRLQFLRSECDGIPLPESTGWLESILDPSRRVVFLDTDGIRPEPLEEGWTRSSGTGQESLANLTNPTECRLVCQLVTGLVLGGVHPGSIAVISPLRSQNKILRRELFHVRGVEVNTVDKYQGMDKDCIILSLVRSNAEGKIGELLKDMRRINVAISRAKRKLILVGSAMTLNSGDVFSSLLDILRRHDWIYRLPPQAPAMYDEKGLDVVSEVCALVGEWEAEQRAAAATVPKAAVSGCLP